MEMSEAHTNRPAGHRCQSQLAEVAPCQAEPLALGATGPGYRHVSPILNCHILLEPVSMAICRLKHLTQKEIFMLLVSLVTRIAWYNYHPSPPKIDLP